MRLIPNVSYGTTQYPERIARRLRVFNIAVWIAAVAPTGGILVRLSSGKWSVAAADAVIACAYISMPLLHRFGPLIAPIVFVALSYGVIFWVSSLVGTNGGERISYFLASNS